jgi:hypothetical protein
MTWLKFLNMFILQWFFIRLARVFDDEHKQVGWDIIRWVVPTTGWKRDFFFIRKFNREEWKVNKKEFMRMLEGIKKINSQNLESLDLSDFRKNISKKDLEDWKYTGLNNVDFIKSLME